MGSALGEISAQGDEEMGWSGRESAAVRCYEVCSRDGYYVYIYIYVYIFVIYVYKERETCTHTYMHTFTHTFIHTYCGFPSLTSLTTLIVLP